MPEIPINHTGCGKAPGCTGYSEKLKFFGNYFPTNKKHENNTFIMKCPCLNM